MRWDKVGCTYLRPKDSNASRGQQHKLSVDYSRMVNKQSFWLATSVPSHSTFLTLLESKVKMIPRKLPSTNTQYYWVLPISIPNANTNIGFLPCFLLELDMRSEVRCANHVAVAKWC